MKNNEHSSASTRRAASRHGQIAALTCAIATAACVDEDAGAEAHVVPLAQVVAQPVTAVRFAAVTAEGVGCPPGSWSYSENAQNNTLSFNFHDFSVIIDPTMTSASSACTLVIKVDVPENTSFSLARVRYQAQAQLTGGMFAYKSSVYSFDENTVDPAIVYRNQVKGPALEVVTLDDLFDTNKGTFVWSGCAEDSTLRIKTTLSVQNARPPQDGLFQLGYLDATIAPSLQVTLYTRPCP
jgi:hypothetical protein